MISLVFEIDDIPLKKGRIYVLFVYNILLDDLFCINVKLFKEIAHQFAGKEKYGMLSVWIASKFESLHPNVQHNSCCFCCKINIVGFRCL